MKKNGSKKVIISLSILSAVLIAVVISLGVVLASFQAVSENSFDVSYTAGANVKADVKTEYQILSYDAAHSGTAFEDVSSKVSTTWVAGNTHEFTGEETEETTSKTNSIAVNNAFSGTANSKYDILLIRFTITNSGTTALKVKGVESVEEGDSNMVVVLAKDAAGTATTVLTEEQTVAVGATLEVYVQVRVQTYTTSARFHRSYQFELAV